ncbi:MAG: ribonuclease III [Tistlia sp.]|uniref:ribonuclease III n=1 Tax=Tistlia sp. TaxID=3057121 RepID=UPI0034A16B91
MGSTSSAPRRLPPPLAALAERLGHSFADPELLIEALTHSSRAGGRSYERLEFLGDRVLGLLIAERLLVHFPEEAEGPLAKRLAMLVCSDTLANIARSLELGPLIKVSPGEAEAGGQKNPAILSDVCEAVLGALYLDGGLEAVRRALLPLADPLIAAATEPPQDNKTRLQEWAQGRGLPLPRYLGVARSGPDHEPRFTVAVEVEGLAPAQGEGRSKRIAEQEAAGLLLDRVAGDKP